MYTLFVAKILASLVVAKSILIDYWPVGNSNLITNFAMKVALYFLLAWTRSALKFELF